MRRVGKKTMLTLPPLEWVGECRRAWLAKQASAASSKEETPLAEAKSRPHGIKRVCLFTEEELNQPAPARKKKPAPAEFFYMRIPAPNKG